MKQLRFHIKNTAPAFIPGLMLRVAQLFLVLLCVSASTGWTQERKHSNKPPLQGKNWVAITGKPLAASAGAMIFNQGGNAVDAAAAMLGAAATMWDTMGWGGETQALIYNPETGKVIAINALGAAPTGATPEYFRSLGMPYPPEYGPLAAITPGTQGGLLVMLAEYGTMSLAEVLAPALEMAAGYPIERTQAENIEGYKPLLRIWQHSREVFLVNEDRNDPRRWAAPMPGQLFKQPDLLATLHKLVEAESLALEQGKSRKEAIMAAYERFYRGDIAEELTRATQQAGGLITMADLEQWQVHIEEPQMTNYKGIEVYKLNHWVQGPVLLQMLNMLENVDLRQMGYNSAEYIHTLYQVMNFAYADRDFYYGDPYYPPTEPIEGLLSKEYALQRMANLNYFENDPGIKPGDPYPFQNDSNPYTDLLEKWEIVKGKDELADSSDENHDQYVMTHDEALRAGTTSIQAADADGWVVSITPSGGWIPAFIAGETGVGLSQRMQSFDMDAERNPFNVLAPGKRPRATLSPSLALKDGKPFLAFSVQGGDFQDQNLLQFFLNIVEFGMDVQQATEAANFGSYQLHSSFGDHSSFPGRLLLRSDIGFRVRQGLENRGYEIEAAEKTSGPITGILIDQEQGTLWGGASDFGDDYGIAW